MAENVGQRLLHDAEHGGGLLIAERNTLQRTVAAALDAGSRLKLLRLPFDGFHQTQIVQDAGAQFAGDAAHHVDHHLVADVLDGVKFKDGIKVTDDNKHDDGMTDERVAA